MTKQIETFIPFDGFYNSISMSIIEDTVDMAFDHEGTGIPDVPDDFWDVLDIKAVCKGYCMAYTQAFATWLNQETGLKLEFTFKELISPAFYNFETDRIKCEIKAQNVVDMLTKLNKFSLKKTIKECHSHHEGFFSFYPNDITESPWTRPVIEWDSNQVETLILALMDSFDMELDVYDLMEHSRCNGVIDNILWEHGGPKALQLVNEYYDANHRE